MKKSELKKLLREEIRKVLREGYLEQNNLAIPEFKKLAPADYKTLETLIKKHDSILDKDENAFEMTSDFVGPDSFSNLEGYKEYYEQVADEMSGELAKVATVILGILNKIK
jgi:hypothetical protein